jgi:alanine-synthesizing transaminase
MTGQQHQAGPVPGRHISDKKMKSILTKEFREIVPSSRVENVRYAIRDLAVLADQVEKQGRKVLQLNIGNPPLFDFPTPPHVIEAVVKAMRDGYNSYGPSSGTPDALEAIRAEAERKGIRNIVDVFLTSGVSEGIEICFAALLDKGHNVLCPVPEYPLYTAVEIGRASCRERVFVHV